jgi:hypothetical protein
MTSNLIFVIAFGLPRNILVKAISIHNGRARGSKSFIPENMEGESDKTLLHRVLHKIKEVCYFKF